MNSEPQRFATERSMNVVMAISRESMCKACFGIKGRTLTLNFIPGDSNWATLRGVWHDLLLPLGLNN
jgi:hypothetical protein